VKLIILYAFKDDLISSLGDSLGIARGKLGLYRESYAQIVGENGRPNHFSVGLEFPEALEDEAKSIERLKVTVGEIEKNQKHNKEEYEKAMIIVDEHMTKYIEKLHKSRDKGDESDGYFEQLIKYNDKYAKAD
jgi:hypothetical protein